jgi:hypothetical protein
MTETSWLVRHKDLVSGVLMVLVGLGAVYQGRNLEVGTLMRMGPGYFPLAIGLILAALGAIIAMGEIRARMNLAREEDEGIIAAAHAAAHKGSDKPEWRGWFCILFSFVAFIVLFKYAGMVPATTAITIISAAGERDNTWKSYIWLAIIMDIIVVVVFWWALQMPFRLFWWD